MANKYHQKAIEDAAKEAEKIPDAKVKIIDVPTFSDKDKKSLEAMKKKKKELGL